MKITGKKILALLLSALMILSVPVVASAEGENWVQIKKSGDALEKGDYYVDVASVKDYYIERYVYQNICIYATPVDAKWGSRFNNNNIAGVEKLTILFPELWQAAVQESHAAHPQWGIDDFYTIQDAWDIMANKVFDQHPELGLADWESLGSYGFDYLSEKYSETVNQLKIDAAAEFAEYENATYYIDSAFASWKWLKAELDGEELYGLPEEIKETFNIYGVEWQPVAKDEASVGSEGGYYLNGNSIEPPINRDYIENIRARGEFVYERYVDELPTEFYITEDDVRQVSTPEELRTAVDDMVNFEINNYIDMMNRKYVNYFEGVTVYVNPDEDALFKLKLVEPIEYYGRTEYHTMYFPLAEHTYMDPGVSIDQILACISKQEPAPEEPTPDEPTPDEPAEPTAEPAGMIHGEHCFCYDFAGNGLFTNIVRFLCAFYNFFLSLRGAVA